MWPPVHLSKEEDQFQRVLRNVDIEAIQKMLTSVQRKIRNLQDEEIYGLTEQLDWTESPLKVVFFA